MTQEEFDQIETLPCGSVIQHGPYNNRIYLVKIGKKSLIDLPDTLISMAEKHGYSKIFAKIPSSRADSFFQAGFIEEASVPGFYNGLDAGAFLAYYLTDERAYEADAETYEKNIQLALEKKNAKSSALDPSRFLLRSCGKDDVAEMAEVYKIVFASYPFPVHDPDYLLETMQSHVDYFCIESKGKIVALSSAEMDVKSSYAEMTDFATLPDWRGHGLAVPLLDHMEKEIAKKRIKTAYTIARSASAGMNITFAKLGYDYAGRLKNNTNISGSIESMNIWYKPIAG